MNTVHFARSARLRKIYRDPSQISQPFPINGTVLNSKKPYVLNALTYGGSFKGEPLRYLPYPKRPISIKHRLALDLQGRSPQALTYVVGNG
jgi:hypothetical protein